MQDSHGRLGGDKRTIRLKDGHLVVEPKLPAGWEGYEADICGRHIRVRFGKVTIT